MYQVLYYSRGGNTKKIAEAVASELGVKAVDVVSSKLDQSAKVIFLGSGCYGGKPGNVMVDFIQAGGFKGRRVALFGTSGGGGGKEVAEMSQALKQKGAVVVGSYYCKGRSFLFFSRGHPDKDDLEGAKRFARDMIKKPD